MRRPKTIPYLDGAELREVAEHLARAEGYRAVSPMVTIGRDVLHCTLVPPDAGSSGFPGSYSAVQVLKAYKDLYLKS